MYSRFSFFQYALVLVCFIYPLVVHWGWSADGWASPWREEDLLFGCGVTDFAGSGVVHLTGGTAAFWGAFFLGPRRHRNPEIPAVTRRFFFQCFSRDGLAMGVSPPPAVTFCICFLLVPLCLHQYGYVFQTLGTLILFFGWFGFNGCSTLYIVGYAHVRKISLTLTSTQRLTRCNISKRDIVLCFLL